MLILIFLVLITKKKLYIMDIDNDYQFFLEMSTVIWGKVPTLFQSVSHQILCLFLHDWNFHHFYIYIYTHTHDEMGRVEIW